MAQQLAVLQRPSACLWRLRRCRQLAICCTLLALVLVACSLLGAAACLLDEEAWCGKEKTNCVRRPSRPHARVCSLVHKDPAGPVHAVTIEALCNNGGCPLPHAGTMCSTQATLALRNRSHAPDALADAAAAAAGRYATGQEAALHRHAQCLQHNCPAGGPPQPLEGAEVFHHYATPTCALRLDAIWLSRKFQLLCEWLYRHSMHLQRVHQSAHLKDISLSQLQWPGCRG